ncbi:glycosyltransferase [Sphingomonas sp. HF-S3]|uniref:Glycosyltransferase n=1 Tax=Sphingomonas rustica TaxID=3103142 RepID=A0ABV0BAQ9_9SPHN
MRATRAIEAHGGEWQAVALPTNSAYLSPARLPGLFRGLAALLRARREGLDLVWLQFSNLADLTYLAWAKLLGLPVLVTPHLGANSRLQRSPLLRRVSASLLTLADRLALLFEGQEDEILLPRRVPRSVIRTFLPEASLTAAPADRSSRPLQLVHASRLSEGKGSFRMLDLCTEMQRRDIDFTARIIGRAEPDILARIRRQIASAGLETRVSLEDWMTEEALLTALGEADILVHLSTLDSFPLIVLEAMAMGTMPVVLDMAGVRAMVTSYDGLVVPAGDAVAQAVDRVATLSPAEMRARGALMAGRVRTDHAWAAVVARLVPTFDETAGVRAALKA